jgi:hypothetical protein
MICHSMRLRFLQQGKDLLPLHTGKTFEKVCNGVTGLQMVKQTLNRYSPRPAPAPAIFGFPVLLAATALVAEFTLEIELN